jgi:hypothetical protein
VSENDLIAACEPDTPTYYRFEENDTPETKATVLLCWIEDLRAEVSRLTRRVAKLEKGKR